MHGLSDLWHLWGSMGFGRCFGPSRTKDDGPPRALPPTLGQSHPVIGLVFVCVGAPCIPACAVLLTPNIVMMETYRMRRCGDESLHEHNQNTRCRGSNKPLAEPQTMKAATYCRHTGPATQCSAALPPGCQYFSYRERAGGCHRRLGAQQHHRRWRLWARVQGVPAQRPPRGRQATGPAWHAGARMHLPAGSWNPSKVSYHACS